MALLEINAKESEQKLQLATKFHLTIICIVFGVFSVFLYFKVDTAQFEFRNYIIKENKINKVFSFIKINVLAFKHQELDSCRTK